MRRQRQDVHYQAARRLVRAPTPRPDLTGGKDLLATHLVESSPRSPLRTQCRDRFVPHVPTGACCRVRMWCGWRPPPSAQDCSGCGARVRSSLLVRTPSAPPADAAPTKSRPRADHELTATPHLLRAGPSGGGGSTCRAEASSSCLEPVRGVNASARSVAPRSALSRWSDTPVGPAPRAAPASAAVGPQIVPGTVPSVSGTVR